MNISKEDIKNISNSLNLKESEINNIVNDFEEILQPVITKNYLSHLVSAIEDIINEKAKKELENRINNEKDGDKRKELLTLMSAKHYRLFPILVKPFPIPNKHKARIYIFTKSGVGAGAIILYDDSLKDKEKRLLIAHELGHLYIKYVSSKKTKSELEKIVTAFSILSIIDKDDFYNKRCKDLIYKGGITEILSEVKTLFKFN